MIRKLMPLIKGWSFVLVFMIACDMRGNQDAVTEIEKAEQELVEAYKSGSTSRLQTLYHDQLIFNAPNGEVLTKAQDIENIQSGVLEVLAYVPSIQRIEVIDDLATVSVNINMKARYSGQAFEAEYQFLRVWKKEKTEWKLIAISGCSL